MSINMKNKIGNIAAAILAIIIIAILQVIFLHLFANEEKYDLASNFENNLPITVIFNLLSGIVYWALFELGFKKIKLTLKAFLLAVICTGGYVVYIKYLAYINPGWPMKLIMIALFLSLGNFIYPYLKQTFSGLRRMHAVRA
jgi:hypothetical protein